MSGSRRVSPGAHPRSRGEHFSSQRDIAGSEGSSPLARGTPAAACATAFSWGLIPARAGNTCGVPLDECNPGAHPRSRGEHAEGSVIALSHGGSSPLARGTHRRNYPADFPGGLIPARAGNTSRACPGLVGGGAHPRSRGEHLDLIFLALTLWGSSPLARGTP